MLGRAAIIGKSDIAPAFANDNRPSIDVAPKFSPGESAAGLSSNSIDD